jgi:hypothetical protein
MGLGMPFDGDAGREKRPGVAIMSHKYTCRYRDIETYLERKRGSDPR